jgi:DNA-binding beta-propeller fold protein YncE
MKSKAIFGGTLTVFWLLVILGWSLSAKEKPNLKGIAYIATEGGHIVRLDLATKKIKRIKITEAGSEMEGVIAGGTMEKVKKGGGTHGAVLSADREKLYVGLLNGTLVTYEFATKKKSEPIKVGQKFCDLQWGPKKGYLYINDMADGNIYVWDTRTNTLVEKIPVSKSLCGIQWSKDSKYVYLSDMVLGVVQVMDWSSKEIVKKIPVGTFIHQLQITPDSKELWVGAPNEFKEGKPYSVAGKGPSEVVIIDTTTNKIKDRITMTDRYVHDIEFSPDGKYALLNARTYRDDSVLLIYDTLKREKLDEISLCKNCHEMNDVELTVAPSPNLCGLDVDWEPKPQKAKPQPRLIIPEGC